MYPSSPIFRGRGLEWDGQASCDPFICVGAWASSGIEETLSLELISGEMRAGYENKKANKENGCMGFRVAFDRNLHEKKNNKEDKIFICYLQNWRWTHQKKIKTPRLTLLREFD